MLTLFFTAMALATVFNAAPGPVFAETVRQGLRGGWRAALAVQFGSLSGDALWALLGLAGVGLVLRIDLLRLPIALAGIAYLLWLAWDAWRESALARPAPASLPHAQAALRSGVMLSITNPQNVAYWAALGSAMGAVGVADPTPEHYVVFFAAFMTASFAWSFVAAGLAHVMVGRAAGGWARVIYRAIALAFVLLALGATHAMWQQFGAPAG
ncbi:MAG: LysE family translocator [Chloroflexi bacterium]|nr:LysE family translocator [Chloroflexota bacterium]